jgi:hypothetical protein
MNLAEIKNKIARGRAVLEKTTDEKERSVIQSVIDNLESEEKKLEKKAENEATRAEKKPQSEKKKPSAKAKKKIFIKKEKKRIPETKPVKKEEKTVKVSKVIPEDEKSTVRDILEKEHFKVIIKEVGGRKVKVTVRHSDRTVAKNKVASAFGTISKKVNSEEEKKKYSKDIQLLESMEKAVTQLIERIYAAFNSHDAKELSAIARKIKSL